MANNAASPESPAVSRAVAERFVRARLAGEALPDYPGPLPEGLAAAYARQDAALALWPDAVAGWKVGKIPDAWLDRLGEDRLVGPIFRRNVWTPAPGEVVELPVIPGGFAAVEAEYVFVLGTDAPAGKTEWSTEEASGLVAELRVGVELAGSPLATINELGPAVVVSDFGNNAGLILGPAVADWRGRALESLVCETYIEDERVGRGGAASIAGGVLAALAFALSRNARRGRPMRAGDVVSTGASTGIHDIVAGQSAHVDFGDLVELRCRAVRARPSPHAPKDAAA